MNLSTQQKEEGKGSSVVSTVLQSCIAMKMSLTEISLMVYFLKRILDVQVVYLFRKASKVGH